MENSIKREINRATAHGALNFLLLISHRIIKVFRHPLDATSFPINTVHILFIGSGEGE